QEAYTPAQRVRFRAEVGQQLEWLVGGQLNFRRPAILPDVAELEAGVRPGRPFRIKAHLLIARHPPLFVRRRPRRAFGRDKAELPPGRGYGHIATTRNKTERRPHVVRKLPDPLDRLGKPLE